MVNRGFTIVELIITITIMGILLLLTVVGVNGTQLASRDDERKADIDSISSHLETFYAGGVLSSASVPTITNLVLNPNLETNATAWNAYTPNASVTTSRLTSGGYSGNAFWRITWSSASAGAVGGAYYGNAGGAEYASVTAGTQYTATGYARTNVSRALCFGIEWYSSAWGNLSGLCTLVQLQANTWTRLSVTGTAPAGAAKVLLSMYSATTDWTAGSILDTDAFMLTASATPYDYGDGASSGWAWSGTSGGSTSSGPVVAQDSVGSYPGTAITISPLITGYLSDINTKSFTTPGQTDPYSSFIAATNNTQTTTGVLPQPTINQYVYQPIDSSGALCSNTSDCRKYNLYYRLEADNTVYMVTSKNQ